MFCDSDNIIIYDKEDLIYYILILCKIQLSLLLKFEFQILALKIKVMIKPAVDTAYIIIMLTLKTKQGDKFTLSAI